MAKREFIEVNQLEKITLEDSLNYMEWHRDSEVDCVIVAPRYNEQDIVKPYLDKLKAEIRELENVSTNYPTDMRIHIVMGDVLNLIDNLLSEQGDTDGNDD